jgi:hypothetical protein
VDEFPDEPGEKPDSRTPKVLATAGGVRVKSDGVTPPAHGTVRVIIRDSQVFGIRGRHEIARRLDIGEFVLEALYLPFYRRKWKRTTTMTNEDAAKSLPSGEPSPVHGEGQMGVSIRERDHAAGEGQLLASPFPARTQSGWIGVGELPVDAADSQFLA